VGPIVGAGVGAAEGDGETLVAIAVTGVDATGGGGAIELERWPRPTSTIPTARNVTPTKATTDRDIPLSSTCRTNADRPTELCGSAPPRRSRAREARSRRALDHAGGGSCVPERIPSLHERALDVPGARPRRPRDGRRPRVRSAAGRGHGARPRMRDVG